MPNLKLVAVSRKVDLLGLALFHRMMQSWFLFSCFGLLRFSFQIVQ